MSEVKASELRGGDWFRKRTGEHRHLVLSESAARYHGLPEGKVYGISFETGNMSAVDPGTIVVRLDPQALIVRGCDTGRRRGMAPGTLMSPLVSGHWKVDGSRCQRGPGCNCEVDGGWTVTPPSPKPMATPHPAHPARAIILTCGECELCQETGDGGECLHTGEDVRVLADEGLDDRF